MIKIIKNGNPIKKKQIKECTYTCFAETTAHGLPNIVKNDNWFLKITWLILVLGGLGYCIYSKLEIISFQNILFKR